MASLREVMKPGHPPTLFAAFLAKPGLAA